jgi:hypothetical protein
VAVAATMVVAAPSAAAAEKVYESETTAECVLAPGVLNEPGTLTLKVKGEGPASVKKGESFAAKNSTITITTPEAWGKLLIALGAHRITGFVTDAEVEAENGSPAVLNIAKPPEFPAGLPVKSKVESAAVTFTVPSENRVFIAGPTTVTAESGNLVVRYDPAPGFTKVGTGSYTSTHKGIQSEVTGFTAAEPGEQVVGPLETSCTEPKASHLAVVPIVAPEPPTVTSVTPNEVGSGGNFKVIIKGTHFEEVSAVHYGTVAATKIITTGTPTKGQCKVKSATELECFTPFHEHGEKLHTTVTSARGTSAETVADAITFWPEVYRNEVPVGTTHIGGFGYGEIDLESPQIQSTVECVNVAFGTGWNEARNGGPVFGHGELLSWWASGHTPTAEHAELSSHCRVIYHGTEENQPTSATAWASAEPPLQEVTQEAVFCEEHPVVICPTPANEHEAKWVHETVIRSVSRGAPGTPWNIQYTEKEGKSHVVIGLPEQCKNGASPENTELSRCPEASEREPSKSPIGCEIPPTPAPPGCVEVQIVSTPPLNVHMAYEGYVEPLATNAGPNGLSPSSWEFEGHAKGEPSLRLRESPTTEGSTTGSVKILGFAGQELVTVK